MTQENFYDPVTGEPTKYKMELDMFLEAGYEIVGDYLFPPPGGTP